MADPTRFQIGETLSWVTTDCGAVRIATVIIDRKTTTKRLGEPTTCTYGVMERLPNGMNCHGSATPKNLFKPDEIEACAARRDEVVHERDSDDVSPS